MILKQIKFYFPETIFITVVALKYVHKFFDTPLIKTESLSSLPLSVNRFGVSNF